MLFFFFFNDTATTEIYTLSLHDALPVGDEFGFGHGAQSQAARHGFAYGFAAADLQFRSEEHTSELQSQSNLVCRLLLEKKKKKKKQNKAAPKARSQHISTTVRELHTY